MSNITFGEIIKNIFTAEELEQKCSQKFVLFCLSGLTFKRFKEIYSVEKMKTKPSTNDVIRVFVPDNRIRCFVGNKHS